jgi:hypothetical protein
MILRKKNILRRHATSFEKRTSSLIIFEISSTIWWTIFEKRELICHDQWISTWDWSECVYLVASSIQACASMTNEAIDVKTTHSSDILC